LKTWRGTNVSGSTEERLTLAGVFRGRLIINRAALSAYAEAVRRLTAVGVSVTVGLSVF
jgi:hypothetical protein